MLYIIATPIGNLDDFSLRAIETLKKVDVVLCEDTRVTKKLLNHYNVQKEVMSFNEHADEGKISKVAEMLKQGKNIAFVSDAGTPNVSDPGAKLISVAKEITGIVPIPGPSAITTLCSIADFPMDKFLFLGFIPAKRKRNKFFEEIDGSKYPVIFYESTHRIIKTLEELKEICNYDCIIGRELTKKFESIYRGKLDEIIKKIKDDSSKGEFVIIVKK